MRLVDAVRIDTGEPCEVWVEKMPKFGARFRSEGVQYKRVPSATAQSFGTGLDFSNGPIRMWSEPPRGRAPFLANHYTPDGLSPLMRNMQDVRDYEARSKETSFKREWTK